MSFPQPTKTAKLPEFHAGVAKLADAPDLGSGAARRGGSSPFTRTKRETLGKFPRVFLLLVLYVDGSLVVIDLKAVRAAVNDLNAVTTLTLDSKTGCDL